MERWDTWELAFGGRADGNPFVDYEIRGVFSSDNKVKTVEGFYDGGCTYKIRFMPSFEVKYRYHILAAFPKSNINKIIPPIIYIFIIYHFRLKCNSKEMPFTARMLPFVETFTRVGGSKKRRP